MYSAVSLSDYDNTDTEMDDRESVYFDTISVAGSEPNRKSLSLSRQTVYHSADDLPAYETVMPTSTSTNNKSNNNPSTPLVRRQSTFLDVGNNPPPGNDEVSASLIDSCKDKDNKKLPITYSQWKSRTWRRFQDGERSVDFILAYRGDDDNPQNLIKRRIFEGNLESEGLELEREKTQKIHFLKIHARHDALCQYCEILKMKMPIRRLKEQENIMEPEFQLMQEMKSFFGRPFDFVKVDKSLFPEAEHNLKFEYSRAYDYLFDTEDPSFFDTATRSMVIQFILDRQKFTEEDVPGNDVGIERLINDGVYTAVYPLHDGDCKITGSQRNLLLNEWASVRQWIRHQPLDTIKDYFGVKIALYFAWLGFYTHMLIPASIVGLICFFYGLITLGSDTISQDICHDNNTILMCPQCDLKCDYWYLKETCVYSKISYLFDNNFTVVFAFFMSFWAVLYLELWKRHSANIIHRWGLTDFCYQAEHPRPQYLARVRNSKKTKFNVVHRVLEPRVPFWKVRFPTYLMSFSAVFLFICLAIAVVFAIVLYRMSLTASRNFYGNSDTMSYKIMVLPATGAVLNLVAITILNFIYDYLAIYLTNLEYRRTQTEFDESLALKIYMFQFVNYYSSIFYIAFFKGKFVGYPAKYNRIFGLRQEECSPGGCLMELCIQLVIIMVGKQAINSILEMLIPWIIKKFKSITTKFGITEETDEACLISCNQWTEDYKLLAWSCRGLFDEYLEMIIQYGFITLFVVAFPLAPLFALINNVLEMRLDAKKFLKFYRRPVPQRVNHIGIWYNIMSILGRLSVGSSAFIIAFSSNFIPMMVYKIIVNPGSESGYLNYTLAQFNTEHFESPFNLSMSVFQNVTSCRYADFRNPPDDPRRYKRPIIYWHILAARLAFIVIFQNVVEVVQMLVAWAIPDVPGKLRDRIKREDYLTREIIIEQEKKRPRSQTPTPTPTATHTNRNTPLRENGNIFTEIPLHETNVDESIPFRRKRTSPDLSVDRTTNV